MDIEKRLIDRIGWRLWKLAFLAVVLAAALAAFGQTAAAWGMVGMAGLLFATGLGCCVVSVLTEGK